MALRHIFLTSGFDASTKVKRRKYASALDTLTVVDGREDRVPRVPMDEGDPRLPRPLAQDALASAAPLAAAMSPAVW